MTPKEFDLQSEVKIDRWIDVDSEEAKEIDDNRAFTKKCIRFGFEDKFFQLDSQGRIWGFSKDKNKYFPFHMEHGKELIGFRLAAKAAN